jgi:hypothetical protein
MTEEIFFSFSKSFKNFQELNILFEFAPQILTSKSKFHLAPSKFPNVSSQIWTSYVFRSSISCIFFFYSNSTLTRRLGIFFLLQNAFNTNVNDLNPILKFPQPNAVLPAAWKRNVVFVEGKKLYRTLFPHKRSHIHSKMFHRRNRRRRRRSYFWIDILRYSHCKFPFSIEVTKLNQKKIGRRNIINIRFSFFLRVFYR